MYVTGFTQSTNFPTANPRQPGIGSTTSTDAFVAKLTQQRVTLSAATATVAESAGSVNLNVTLSAAQTYTTTVTYATGAGTAQAGSDYDAAGNTLVFGPGQTTRTISIPIVNDTADEDNETFTVTLSTPFNALLGAITSATVTITDDDAAPTVAWGTTSFSAGEGQGNATLSVELSAPSSRTITVNYATSNGSAKAGDDYTAVSGTLSFAPGETSKTVGVALLNDVLPESAKTVNLTLSAPTNATLGTPSTAILTIQDDETTSSSVSEYYSYDLVGNLRTKAGFAYDYTSSRPHAVTSVGGQVYSYDANGNLANDGPRAYVWDSENRAQTITKDSVTETYSYDGDSERVTKARGGVTTMYLEGVWEEVVGGNLKRHYSFNGAVVAVREGATVSYLHSDHLGSISVATNDAGGVTSSQQFDPWGKVRSGGVGATSLNYTGQRLDETGLLYYRGLSSKRTKTLINDNVY